jgi:long-chain acyl-CoA synthetase
MSEWKNLLDLFATWRTAPHRPCLVDAREGRDLRYSQEQVATWVAGLALGLEQLGIRKGDRVAIICGDRPEWHVVDFAVQHLGAVDVPIYPTLLPAQVKAILADSGAVAVVAENADQLAKVLEVRGNCPALAHVVLIDGEPPAGVLSLAALTRELDLAAAETFLESRRGTVAPEDLATLIYTSGTTGEPKGAMLTHDNFVFNATSAASVMPWPEGGEVGLAFLPLSHVLERLVDYIYFLKGTTIAYCGVLEIAEAFRRIRPHLFTAVPRVYEKIYARIFEEVGHAPKVRQTLFRTAVRIALEAHRSGRKGLLYRLFDPIVYRKIRDIFGGRLRFSISGGAPLPVYAYEFFHAMGVEVLEGYGLTETSPVITVNPLGRSRPGSPGLPIPGVEVKIAEDGEILTRGRHVMRGYWGKPEATAAVLSADGWFATGDIGELDSEGYLRITDRKKDLLVTAGGKNVAPQPIEAQIVSSPFVENAVLFGDRKPYIVALIVPNFEELERWAKGKGLATANREELLSRREVLNLYQEILDGVNSKLARFETVKKFALLPQSLTMDAGELTPTLKVKRRVIEARYRTIIDGLFADGTA